MSTAAAPVGRPFPRGQTPPGPGWQARRRRELAQIEADLMAALPGRPNALQRLTIENIAALTVELRGMRARGKRGPEVTALDRAILQAVRTLGLGGALSGYDVTQQNRRRSAARTGGSNEALQAFVEGTPTTGHRPEGHSASQDGAQDSCFDEGDG